jgi:hypothetical protein
MLMMGRDGLTGAAEEGREGEREGKRKWGDDDSIVHLGRGAGVLPGGVSLEGGREGGREGGKEEGSEAEREG